MALGRNEIFIIVRAQNMASSSLRRVANDLNNLGKMEGFHAQQTQLAINQARLLNQQLRLRSRLESVQTGTRRIAAERALNNVERQRVDHLNKLRAAERELSQVDARSAAVQARRAAEIQQFEDLQTRATKRGVRDRLNAYHQFQRAQLGLRQISRDQIKLSEDEVRAVENHDRALRRLGIAQQRHAALGTPITADRLENARVAVRRAEEEFGRLARTQQMLDDRTKRYASTVEQARPKIANFAQEHADLARAASRHQVRLQALDRENLRIAGSTDTLANRMARESAALDANADAANHARSRIVALAREEQVLSRELAINRGRIAQNVAQHQALREAVRQHRWDNLARGGRIMADTGRAARLFGIAAVAGVGLASQAYADFSTQATLAATQTGRTTGKVTNQISQVGRNSDVIMRGILRQMRQFPASAEEMSAAAYEIYSSTNLGSKGIQGVNDGLRLLNVLNKASVAGQVDLSDATAAMTSIMNSYGTQVSEMPRVLNRMFAAVRFGRMTFADFIGVFSQIIPAGRAADQSLDTVLSSFAAVTRLIPNVRMAGAGFARMLEIFGRADFIKGAKEFGITMTDARGNMLQLPDLLKNMRNWLIKLPLKERSDALRNFFKIITAGTDEKGGTLGTIQGRRVFSQLMKSLGVFTDAELKRLGAFGKEAKKSLGVYSTVTKQVQKDNKEFAKSFNALSRTGGVRFKTFINSLRALMLRIGREAMPLFIEIGRHIENLLDWWDRLDKGTRDQIVRWTAYVAILSVVGGTLAAVVGGILGLVSVLGRARLLMGSTGIAIMGVVAALSIFTGNWNNASDAVDGFARQATSSLTGFIVMAGLVTAASLKINRALQARRVQKAATAGMNAEMASQMALFGLPGGGRERGALRAEMKAASLAAKERAAAQAVARGIGPLSSATRAWTGVAGATAAAATAAEAIPPVFLATAAAVAAAYIGLRIWRRGADDAAEAARKAASEAQNLANQMNRPLNAARGLAGIGGSVRELKRAQISLKDINAQIRELRAQKVQAAPEDRPGIQRQIASLLLQRADALDAVDAAARKSNQSFAKMNQFVQAQIQQLSQLHGWQKRINDLRAERARITAGATRQDGEFFDPIIQKRVVEIDRAVAKLRAGIMLVGPAAQRNEIALRNSFARINRDLARQGDIRRVSRNVTDQMAKFAEAKGRMLTLPEMKQFIRLVLHPGALRQARGEIAAFLRGEQRQATIKVKVVTQSNKIVQQNLQRGVRIPIVGQAGQQVRQQDLKPLQQKVKVVGAQAAANAAHTTIAKILQKRVPSPRISANTVQAAAAGATTAASFMQGFVSGVGSRTATAHVNVAVSKTVNEVKQTVQKGFSSRSPSKWAMGIGYGIAQGLAMGITDGAPVATRSAQNVVDSTKRVFDNLEVGSPNLVIPPVVVSAKVGRIDIPDLNRLSAEKISKPLSQGLMAGLKNMEAPRALANAVNRTIRAGVVAAEAFSPSRRTKREIGDPIIKGIVEGIREGLPALQDVAKLSVDLFSGPWLTSDKFQQAMEGKSKASKREIERMKLNIASSRREVEKFTKEMNKAKTGSDKFKDAQINLKEAQLSLKDAQAELRASGGRAKRIETVADLQRDLGGQLRSMRQFNTGMERLRRRNVPKALLDQLASLGSEGAKRIAMLSRASNSERRRYVRTWQQMMKEVKKSAQVGLRAAAKAAIQDFIKQSKEELSNRKNEIRQTFTDWWSSLFDTDIGDVDTSGAQGDVVSTYMELFAGPWLSNARQQAKLEWGIPFSKEDLMKDLQQQVAVVKQWKADLDGILTRSGNIEFVEYLRSLGPDAAQNIHTLTTMTDAELQQYIGMWNDIKEPAHTAATEAINNVITKEDVLAAVKNANDRFREFREGLVSLAHYSQAEIIKMFPDLDPNMVAALGKTIEKLPAGLIDYLKELGPEQGLPIMRAILQMSPDEIEQLKKEWRDRGSLIALATTQDFGLVLDQWKKQGNNIAMSLIAGVTEKQGELLAFFRNLFANMLKESNKSLKKGSPSRVYMEQGESIIDGLVAGMSSGKGLTVPMPSMTKPMVGGAYANTPPQGNTTNIEMNVRANSDESLMTTLERASFRLRNRGV